MPGDPSGRSRRASDGSSSFLDYLVAYAKQETLDPIVGQFKALGSGIAGALLVAIGTVLLGVGFVRALQGQFGSSAGAVGEPSARTPVAPDRATSPGATSSAAASSSSVSSVSSKASTSSATKATVQTVVVAPGHPAGPTTSLVASSQANPYGSGHPLSGNWSWVPYMGGSLLCLLVALLCVARALKGVPK
jgi:hypothetical protein